MKKKVIGIISLILLIGLAVGTYFVIGNYSSGYRTGRIMKISKKGVMFKTYEGQLNVGGLDSGGDDGVATTVWEFSVTDEGVLKDIEEAVDNGRDVKLYYNEKFYQFDFRGDTKYFVYKVAEIDEEE